MSRPTIELEYAVLDCPDPSALARFYARLLDAAVVREDGDWAEIRGAGGMRLSFQRSPEFVPHDWPTESITAHLDLVVDDMDAAQEFAVGVGATLVDDDADHPTFRVFRDPAGHIFCLCDRS